jgi:hypothetical protein
MNFAKDFSATTRKALAAKGMSITGIQLVSNDLGWADPTKAYMVNHNGTGKLRTFSEVLNLAK